MTKRNADKATVKELDRAAHLFQTGDAAAAAAIMTGIVTRHPDFAEAHSDLGLMLASVGRFEEAAAAYQRAIALKPDLASAHLHLGLALIALGRPGEALEPLRQAETLLPERMEAAFHLATALYQSGDYAEAARLFRRAVELDSSQAGIRNNLGLALKEAGKLDEAAETFKTALDQDGTMADTWNNLGTVLQARGQAVDAAECYESALSRRPGTPLYVTNLLSCATYRDDLDLPALAALALRFGRLFDRPQRTGDGETGDPERKLKIGLVSSDFRDHPVATNLLPGLIHHDRSQFALYFYTTGGKTDAVTGTFKSLAEGWRDIGTLDDSRAAETIRSDAIDILVFLAGRFDHNRLTLAGRRAAPVQISLHDVATSGLASMDYLIGDPRLLPRSGAEFFTERLLRLPHFYLADPPRNLPVLNQTRSGTPVFGCFNNPAKIGPATLALWGRILKARPESRLMLKFLDRYAVPSIRERIVAGLVAAGARAEQVDLLSGWEERADLMARYNTIDVALDTLPFSGSTTTFQALLMGVPVVTRPLDRMVSRWSAALLAPLGLGELIAATDESYVDIALRIADEAEAWRKRRGEIRARLIASPFCDSKRWARQMERLYRAVWRRHCLTDTAPPSPAQARDLLIQGRYREAVTAYRRLIARTPGSVEAEANLGTALNGLGLFEAAAAAYGRALVLKPDSAEILVNLGEVLLSLRHPDEAESVCAHAIALAPQLPEAHYNYGNALHLLDRLDEAEIAYRQAVAIRPGFAQAHGNLGLVLNELRRPVEAAQACEQALALDGDLVAVQNTYAGLLIGMGHPDQAARYYQSALARTPHEERLARGLLMSAMYRDDLDGEALKALHLDFGRRFDRDTAAIAFTMDCDPDRRLRVGLLSSDFRGHPVAFNLLPVLRRHDRSRIELYVYAAVEKPDRLTKQVQALADVWRDVEDLGDRQTADLIRDDRIDILVLLAGRFDRNRPAIAAWRAAPVQISLHDVATSGLREMDYIVGDPWLIPRRGAEFFTERPIRLTHFYVADFPADLPAIIETRTGPPVFGSFNNPAKMSPRLLSLWGRILAALPDSRLVLKYLDLYVNEPVCARIRDGIIAAGARADQIEFLTANEDTAAFVERYNHIDVALDTFPFCGSTTSFQTLAMGVPLVTLPLDRMVSRWSASMLHALGLDEMIADSEEGYVAIAIRLAEDAAAWRKRRREISARLAASPLCDPGRWARQIERLYRAVWRKYCRRAAPRAEADRLVAAAMAAHGRGRPEEAPAHFRAAIRLAPDFAEAQCALGATLAGLGRLDEAIAAYDEAIALKPDFAAAWSNLGVARQQSGHLDEAVTAYRQAIAAEPTNGAALTNLGVALVDLGRVDEALAACSRAVALNETQAEAWSNLGIALRLAGRLDEAIAAWRRALALNPGYVEAHRNLAMGLLMAGQYREGFAEFEWRRALSECPPLDSTRPEWRGEPLAGRTILLHSEQGLGDSLQFVRYATPLAEAGARVVLAVPRPLVRLLATVPGVAEVTDRTPLPDHDWHIPLLSLPHRLGTELETIPAACPYIRAEPEARAAWQTRLAALPGRKVGLVWSGDPRPHDVACALVDRRRSLSLAQLAPLAAVTDVTFVSLQKGSPAEQARTPPPGMILIDWMDEIGDFADTAALTDALDLVITVDTSVAHLAGALAKPVWILSRFDGCWRWLLERTDSPWYPSARLFRQTAPGDWEPAIATLTQALTYWVRS